MAKFNELIKEIGKELDIKVTLLSDNWLKVLEKDNKIKTITGYKFPLNDHALGNILDDKGLFYDLMIYKNYPIIEHKVIFKNTKEEEIINYFNSHQKQIVVKGNIGTCGKEVYLIDNQKQLFEVISELFQSQYSISLCPYYHILYEYRAIILDNEVELIYGKKRPLLIGNGKSNLLKLAQEFNFDYFSKVKKQNFDINYIPKLNEEILLDFKFNLSQGSIAFFDLEKKTKDKIRELSLNIAKDINLKFGSIDIIETTNHELFIMEANSGVMMSNIMKQQEKGIDLAYNIYKKAIIKMFEE